MLNHKAIVESLAKGLKGRGAVTLRETNFGYVINCDRPDGADSLRERAARFLMIAMAIAAMGIWLVPGQLEMPSVTAALSLILLAFGYFGMLFLRPAARGFELHVDSGRRELRASVTMPNGDAWMRATARFEDVAEVSLRAPGPDEDASSLSLLLLGREEQLPVAIGPESMLRNVQTRLIMDLKPIEDRLAARIARPRPTRPTVAQVFPEIGPDEHAY